MLTQRLTLGFRDFPSRESVHLVVVLSTVQGRSSSRFFRPRTSLHGFPRRGSPLGPTCDETATTEVVTASSLPSRELVQLAARTPREVYLAPHNPTHSASVCHGRPSLDKPGAAYHASQLAADLLGTWRTPCRVHAVLRNSAFGALPSTRQRWVPLTEAKALPPHTVRRD